MYNAPPPNVMRGIGLVQAGRRAEALPYLRYAAQSEDLTAEGWLWLAAATDDLEEYRHCVNRALRLDPYHPVASRMRAALDALDSAAYRPRPPTSGTMPPVPAAPYGARVPRPAAARRARPSWLRRIVRAVVLALLIGGGLGICGALVTSGALTNLVRDWLRIEELHTLDFTVGESPGYHFRVDVPTSWQPANADNPSWRATRERLEAAFPQTAELWDTLDERFSAVVRDPVYGTIMPLVRIVETDSGALRAGGMIAALTLHEILPLPAAASGEPDTVCARMRSVEAQFIASGGLGEAAAGGQVLDTALTVRSAPDDCVFAVQRRYSDLLPEQVPLALAPDSAPDATREVVIAVPVSARRFAVWQIVYADAMHDDYASAVERAIETLSYVQ